MSLGPQDERTLNLRTNRTNQQTLSQQRLTSMQNTDQCKHFDFVLTFLANAMMIRPAVIVKD